MKRGRRIIKYFSIALAVLVIVAGLAVLSFATAPVRAGVKSLVMSLASSEAMQIRFEDIDGWPPFAFTLKGLTLSDRHGAFAAVPEAEIKLDIWALVRGKVALPVVRAKSADILRLPDLPPSPEPAGNKAEQTLPALALGELKIGRLLLGAPVIGQAAALAVEGGVDLAQTGAMTGTVKINRVDGRRASLSLDFKRPEPAQPFTGKMLVDEEADGLLAAALGQNNVPAYKMDISAEGDPNQIGGRLTLATEGRDNAQARFQAVPLKGGWTLKASLSGELQALVPNAFGDILAGPMSGAVDADLMQDPAAKMQGIVLRQADIQIGAVQAKASGQIGGAKDALNFTATASRGEGSTMRLMDGSLSALELTGAITTQDGQARLDSRGRISGLAQQGWQVPHLGFALAALADGPSVMAAKKLPFALKAELQSVTSPKGRMVAVAGKPIALDASGEALQGVLEKAAVVWPDGAIQFAGAASAQGASGQATLTIGDGAPIDDLLGLGLPAFEALTLKADGVFFDKKGGKGFDVTGSVKNVTLKGHDKPLLPAETTFKAHIIAGDGNGSALAVKGLSLDNSNVTATADVMLRQGAVDGALKAALNDLSRIAPALAGKATLEAKLGGTMAQPLIDAVLNVPQGRAGKHALEKVSVTLKSHIDGAKALVADLKLGGRYAEHPLGGSARLVQAQNGVLNVPAIDLAIGSNTIKGQLAQGVGRTFDGALGIALNDLSEILGLALMEGEGRGTATVQLRGTDGGQGATLAANLAGISMAGVGIGKLDVDMRGSDLLRVPRVEGVVNAANVRHGETAFSSISAKANAGPDGATVFEVRGQGHDAEISGSGRIDPLTSGDGFRLNLEAMRALAKGVAVKLTAPAIVVLQNEAVTIEALKADIGGGALSLRGQVQPQLDVDITIGNLPAALANRFVAALDAKGSISATAHITGTAQEPKADWTVKLDNAHAAPLAKAGVPALDVSAQGTATKLRSSVEALVTGAGARLNIGGHVAFAGPLELKVTGLVPLAPLAVASGQDVRLGGQGNVDVTVTGTLKKPSIGGHVSLVDVLAIDGGTGMGIKDTRGRLSFRNDRLTLDNVTGALIHGGTFSANGTVDVAAGGQMPADLRLIVKDGRYNDGGQINAGFSANIAVTGALMGQSLVKGAIDLGKVEIALPDRIAGSPTRIEVQHRNRKNGTTASIPTRAKAKKTPAFGSAMMLDMQINAYNGIFVRGGGLDAELGGQVHVKGTVKNPQLVGGFDLQRGRMQVLTRRLDFTRGRIEFLGGLEPSVDFAADAKNSDVTITVGVSGPIAKPDLKFTSNPELTSEEILSRLLFDKGVSKLSPLEVAQLVSEIARLTGVSRGPGALDRVRQTLGVDDVDIKQDASGDTRVGIGKRINDKMRLGIEQGAKPGSSKMVIDLDITRNVKARGEANSNGSGRVGIAVEKEY